MNELFILFVTGALVAATIGSALSIGRAIPARALARSRSRRPGSPRQG